MYTNPNDDHTLEALCKKLRYKPIYDGTIEASLDKRFDLKRFKQDLTVVLGVIDRNKLAGKTLTYRKAANLPYSSIRYVDIEQHPIGLFNHKYFEYLTRGAWLKQGDSIIIDSLPCKARLELVSALGNELMTNGMPVLFKEMKAMLQDLLVADAKGQLKPTQKPLKEIDVLVLNDFELNLLSTKEAYFLASLIQARNEKGGFILMTKAPLEDEIASSSEVGLVGQLLIKHILPCCHQLNFVASN